MSPCPRCGSNAVISNACASCGHGVRSTARQRHTGASAPYQRTSPTSRLGAVAVAPKVTGQKERIVEYVRTHGPSTRMEVVEGTGLPVNVVTARVHQAIYGTPTQAPQLRRAGTRLCRVTGHEAEAVEYVATQGGLRI